MGASQANKEKRRIYQHKLKVRERKWMQTRTTYASKKVQFEEEVDQANIAAQRAYSRTQQQLNNARSLAILQNQEDFKKMLANEGMIEVSAAERGVRGRSVARQLVQNSATFGLSQAMRSRGLTQAGYDARETYGDINRQLKGNLNQAFGKVAIQPVQDLAPPPPVMQNVGMTLMLGMGQAIGAGIEGNAELNKQFQFNPFKKRDGGGDSSKDSGGGKKNQSFGSFGTSFGSPITQYTIPSFSGYFGGM